MSGAGSGHCLVFKINSSDQTRARVLLIAMHTTPGDQRTKNLKNVNNKERDRVCLDYRSRVR